MCFGDDTETQRKEVTLPSWLDSAAQTNVSRALDLTSQPFKSYTGTRVADLSPDENSAHGMIRSVAGSGNPYTLDIESLYRNFASAPAGSVSAPSILGGGYDVAGGNISDYMNPYIAEVLAPQLRDIGIQGAQTRNQLDKEATFSGAFGDARSGVERGMQREGEDRLRESVIGKTYSDAFGAASGLRGQDIANLISTGATNANLNETALNRAAAGGELLTGLDKYNTGRTVDLANAQASAGAAGRGVEQRKLDTQYEEFLREQGYPKEMIQLLSSVLGSTPHGKTETTYQPDNSGFGLLGSVAGSAASAAAPYLAAMMFSDRRLKTDIIEVGQLYDGTPVYRYRMIGSDAFQIGLMAQDLRRTNPDAVHEVGGVFMVDYKKATDPSVELGE